MPPHHLESSGTATDFREFSEVKAQLKSRGQLHIGLCLVFTVPGIMTITIIESEGIVDVLHPENQCASELR